MRSMTEGEKRRKNMLNSLLIFGSSYNKSKKVSILSFLLMIANVLFVQYGKMGINFVIINLLLMSVITFGIRLINNNKANATLSVFSILVWSICIDIVTYFMYSKFTGGLSLPMYVLNGILFNIRYVFFNAAVLCGIKVIEKLVNKKIVLEKVIK